MCMRETASSQSVLSVFFYIPIQHIFARKLDFFKSACARGKRVKKKLSKFPSEIWAFIVRMEDFSRKSEEKWLIILRNIKTI